MRLGKAAPVLRCGNSGLQMGNLRKAEDTDTGTPLAQTASTPLGCGLHRRLAPDRRWRPTAISNGLPSRVLSLITNRRLVSSATGKWQKANGKRQARIINSEPEIP